MEYKRTFSADNGAKKGLEMKMKFWSQDKRKTEFNIAVAQALNLAVQSLVSHELSDENIEKETRRFFGLLMKFRNDEYFRNMFIETSLEDEKVEGENEVKLGYE